MLDNGSEPDLCPDCASTNIVRSQMRDQIICRECGLIFEPLAPQLAPAQSMRTSSARPRAAPKAKAKKAAGKKRKR